MPPVLEAARALALGVALSLVLLRQVAFAVRDDAAHVVDIVIIIGLWILLRVLLQNSYDLASTCVERKGERTVRYDCTLNSLGDMNL